MSDPKPYLLTIEELATQVYNCSARQVRAMLAREPSFPRPVELGPRMKRYVRHEHEAFALTFARRRDDEPPALAAARAAGAAGKAHAPFGGAI